MKKMLGIMLAIIVLLSSAFYFFYIKGNNEPIIDETIDYEEQLGGNLVENNKVDLSNEEDVFLIEKEIEDGEILKEEIEESINQDDQIDVDIKEEDNLEKEITKDDINNYKEESSDTVSKNNGQDKIEESIKKDKSESEVDKKLEIERPVEQPKKSKKEESFIIETIPIKYKIIEKRDRLLARNETVTQSEGENGEEEITYKIIKVDGKEVERIKVNSKITKNAIDKIILIGAKPEENTNKPEENTTYSKDLPNTYSFSYKEDLEKELIDLINNYRSELGIHELTAKSDLKETSRYKSNSMLQLNYFGHSNPNFEVKTFSHLMKKEFEVSYRSIGENLGYASPADSETIKNIFESFKASPAHNENMINSKFSYIGIGAINAPEPGNTFYKNSAIITVHFAGN